MHSPAELKFSEVQPSERCAIATVTVAYNGARVLRQHLESLKRQSRKPDQIVVVDNASTDNTCELLATEYPEVKLISLPENGGIGGGLAAGLAHIVSEKRYDWIWIFDQDSVPSSDALVRLLGGLRHLNGQQSGTAILAPQCKNMETGMAYPGLLWRGNRYSPILKASAQPITFVDMVISSGSLIRTEAIGEAGLPRADFFMDFVDYEYCLRLRRRGFRIAVVHDSILDHAIGTPTTFKVLGSTKSWADHAPWREYYMARNETFTMWKYNPKLATKCFVAYRLANHALGIVFFGKYKTACLRMIWRGFLDGRAGRLGIRFRPEKPENSPNRRRAGHEELFDGIVSGRRATP